MKHKFRNLRLPLDVPALTDNTLFFADTGVLAVLFHATYRDLLLTKT